MGAADAVSRGLRKLLKLRGVPDLILAVNNEVSDLQLLLNEVGSLVNEAKTSRNEENGLRFTEMAGVQSLPRILKRIRAKLSNLDAVLRRLSANGLNLPAKVLWLKEEPNVLRIRNELGSLKQDLTTALGLSSSSTALRVQVELQDLRVATDKRHLSISQTIVERHSSLESSFLKSQDDNEKGFDRLEQQLLALTEQVQQHQATPASSHGEVPWVTAANQRQESMPTTTAFGALQMRFSQRRKCQSWCKCACHSEGRSNTPKFLKSVMGMLYVGYFGVPAPSPSCDKSGCKGNSEGLLQVHYFFPSWFLGKVISMALGVSRTYGPEFCLRVANVRADWDPIFTHCYNGNIDAVRSVLVAGEASILDVNAQNGNSLLHMAMFRSQLEVVELLIQFGADPHVENHTRESPYDMAWNSILSFQGTSNSLQWKTDQLLKIYPNGDACVERRKLTRVHKAVMHMLYIELEKELVLDHTLIDQPDANGRTPLHWAAARGNSEAVRTLLKFGASPDTPDFISQGPLRASLKAPSPECMELLIQAGAKVDQRDNWGQTCLIAAMYYSHPESFITTLLSSGADINASDRYGQSPILEAVRHNHPSAVRILMRQNTCVISVATSGGLTPLLGGVFQNATNSVSVLLNYTFNHGALDRAGRSVLHYAALFADVPMLRILARARLCDLDFRLRDQQNCTAAELAHKRIERLRVESKETSVTELEIVDWETAFAELLLSVSVPTRNRTSKTSMGFECDSSDSNDSTTSFHSAIDHFAEMGIV